MSLPELIVEPACWDYWWDTAIRNKKRYIVVFNHDGNAHPQFCDDIEQVKAAVEAWTNAHADKIDVHAIHDTHGPPKPQRAVARWLAVIV